LNAAYISIGSNIGDRLNHLTEAVRALHSNKEVNIHDVSSIYETVPVGYTDQADFLNLVIHLKTNLVAQELLSVCQGIEKGQGRVRDIRWGPRTVDLDILLYNQDTIETANLLIPHPRMHERAFVLIPLLEINPLVTDPVNGEPYSKRSEVEDEGVVLWKKSNGVEGLLE